MSATYRMAPAGPGVRWLRNVIASLGVALAIWLGLWFQTWTGAFVVLAMTGVVIACVCPSLDVRFVIGPEGLQIRDGLWRRRIPFTLLDAPNAVLLPLDWNVTSYPVWRVWGVMLPGYRSGWYRLANREKALVYVTDPASVVSIPTTQGYSLLLSVDKPEEFLSALKRGGLTGRLQPFSPSGVCE